MGLWSKGLERAQMGVKRLEEGHVDIEKMEIICDFLNNTCGGKICSYRFTTPDTMVWTIYGNPLPEFRFGSLVVSNERDVFDHLQNEIYLAAHNRKYPELVLNIFDRILAEMNRAHYACDGHLERIFEIMS